MVRIAGIEGGGTSWVAAISEDKPNNIIEKATFATEFSPQKTLEPIKKWLSSRQFDSIGIASFGPVIANPKLPHYGWITSTPKPGWKNTDVLTMLGLKDQYHDVPFLFDTDVNAPALAEYTYRNDEAITSSAYITIGTGVGVGLVINGTPVHGLMHPEAGHIMVRQKEGDSFTGTCPFHGHCIEGMCSTGSLAARKRCQSSDLPNLPDDDEIWDICAYYVAQLCISLLLIVSIEHISIGGGVMNRKCLLPLVRSHFINLLQGYVENDNLVLPTIDSYISEPIWGADAGIIGATYLGYLAYIESKKIQNFEKIDETSIRLNEKEATEEKKRKTS